VGAAGIVHLVGGAIAIARPAAARSAPRIAERVGFGLRIALAIVTIAFIAGAANRAGLGRARFRSRRARRRPARVPSQIDSRGGLS